MTRRAACRPSSTIVTLRTAKTMGKSTHRLKGGSRGSVLFLILVCLSCPVVPLDPVAFPSLREVAVAEARAKEPSDDRDRRNDRVEDKGQAGTGHEPDDR